MNKAGAVVLNYKNYEETINCVKSLLEQDFPDLHIAVVDNGSNNESEAVLRETFGKSENVSFVMLNDNLGFAKGNNAGIEFLRKKGCEFIFVVNSDIVFSEKNIVSQAVSDCESGVGVINFPTVRSNGERECSTKFSKKYVNLRIMKQLLTVEFKYLFNIGKSEKKNDTPKTEEIPAKSTIDVSKVNTNEYVVTGCAYCLTPSYFEKYDGLFGGTFLYFEEYALIIQLSRGHLNTMEMKTAPLIHKHGASSTNVRTDVARKSARKVLGYAVWGK